MGNLRALKVLNVSDNQLVALPPSICALELEVLNVECSPTHASALRCE